MYLVLLSTIILLQPLGSSFLPSIEGILILLAASRPPLPLTTMLLLLLRWLRHNGGERRALPNLNRSSVGELYSNLAKLVRLLDLKRKHYLHRERR